MRDKRESEFPGESTGSKLIISETRARELTVRIAARRQGYSARRRKTCDKTIYPGKKPADEGRQMMILYHRSSDTPGRNQGREGVPSYWRLLAKREV